ncbi:unnamed protein product [Staurois parvus]|uniref:Uncharacterized protein n=1 Tax=Staurois parvus TaxID=386267 RepID=A0ABN9BDN5_9NEOB|nr:unnamed protein product [Staurois parvus]
MPASGFRVPVPVTSERTGAGTGGKFEIFKKFHFLKKLLLHSKTLLFQCISHTFCPECFALCPACILIFVLSAWKLRKVHGVQKASLYVKSGFRPAREQR